MPETPTFRPQTKWETREAQCDLIGRSVLTPELDVFGKTVPGAAIGFGGYGSVAAFRRTDKGPQAKVNFQGRDDTRVYFLRDLKASGIPEAIAAQF